MRRIEPAAALLTLLLLASGPSAALADGPRPGERPKPPEALEMAGREQVDCALLDVNLGSEKIDPVADLLSQRGCPFIFTTGYGRSGIPAAHSDRPVLQKPFRMDDLSKLIFESEIRHFAPAG